LTPGSTAPVGSVSRPVMADVLPVCANTGVICTPKTMTRTRSCGRTIFFELTHTPRRLLREIAAHWYKPLDQRTQSNKHQSRKTLSEFVMLLSPFRHGFFGRVVGHVPR